MNYPCTYFDIYRWMDEIQKIERNPVSLRDLLNDIPPKLIAFKQDNSIIFGSVKLQTETLNKKYFQILTDAEGKETLNIGKDGNPIFIDGASEEEFKKELDVLFTTKTSVKK